MTNQLRPYVAYKSSGVMWLGKVPAHWEVRRLRNVSELRVSNVDKHTREGEAPVRLCNYVDVYKNDRIRLGMAFMAATATAEEVNRFRLRPGDVLITKDSEVWNDIGVPALVQEVDDDVISGYHLALLRPDTGHLDGGFLYRALEGQGVGRQLHVRANGVTRYGLSQDAIKSVRLPVPPRIEQRAIVRFLDYADRRIRRYIRAKQKLITLLEEQKQAIIQQAVTGQIDVRTGQPYPAYKDSGVEWLGEVPAHWDNVRFSRVIAMALAERLLVDADVSDRPRRLPRVAPCDGAAHHAPGLVPADARDLTRAFDRTALQDQIDDQPLQQHCEAAPRLGPRHPHLLHAMGRTLHPRNLGMQVRLKLTRVEMAPRPLCRMIEGGHRLAAVGTGPARRLVLQPHVDPLVLGLQRDARHVPGGGDPQNRLEQLGILHPLLRRSVLSAGHLRGQSAAEQAPPTSRVRAGGLTSHPGALRPTQIPEGPINECGFRKMNFVTTPSTSTLLVSS